LECPLESCLFNRKKLRDSDKAGREPRRFKSWSYYAQCTTCKAGEEIIINGSKMEAGRKFKKEGGDIWHYQYDGTVCGRCKLFRTNYAGGNL